MLEGLLWFYRGHALPVSAQAAAKRYFERTRLKPNTVYVNPSDCNGDTVVDGLCVKRSARVSPGYLWVMYEEKAQGD